jgi:Proto-chlorophyllide reductase 57 kD subunit
MMGQKRKSGEQNEPQPVTWSEEAEQRLERVPSFARGMARKGIERFAAENGYSIITPEVYDVARKRFGM